MVKDGRIKVNQKGKTAQDPPKKPLGCPRNCLTRGQNIGKIHKNQGQIGKITYLDGKNRDLSSQKDPGKEDLAIC
jgi:hypothetical protein